MRQDAVASRYGAENERFQRERPESRRLQAEGAQFMPNGTPMSWMAATYRHLPLFVRNGHQLRFEDVDGHTYIDFNLADMSAFTGYAPRELVEGLSARLAAGTQFMLPGEDAVAVARSLAGLFGLPKWQFTLSASQANAEVIRLARVATGRTDVLMFAGKYHGHADDVLVDLENGAPSAEQRGLPAAIADRTRIVQFNDLGAVESALASQEVAVVLAEPAMTNNHALLLPREGYLEGLRELTSAAGTLLACDETHTLVCGPGGLTKRWGLRPDFVILGKSIAGGIPCGAYGMTEAIAAELEYPVEAPEFEYRDRVATGGTLFANALSMAAARITIEKLLTEDAYRRTAELGRDLEGRMRREVEKVGLPWSVQGLSSRCAFYFSPEPPENGADAAAIDLRLVRQWQRLYFANRGIWEAIVGAGPTVGVPATRDDVDAYVAVFSSWLSEAAEIAT